VLLQLQALHHFYCRLFGNNALALPRRSCAASLEAFCQKEKSGTKSWDKLKEDLR